MQLSRYVTKRNLLIITHVGALFPLAWLLWDWWAGNLSINPIQDITFRTGKPALVLLVLSLAVTPVSSVLGLRQVIPTRRWLGLYAFGYTSLHFLVFIGLDYGFDTGLLYEAIFEKRYALVGFAAFLIMLPLALTSTKGWMRRLGRAWKRLHKLAYAAGVLGILHYLWVVKADTREPFAWGAVLLVLFVLRIPAVRQRAIALRRRLSGETAPATIGGGMSEAARMRIEQAKQRARSST